jgi:hypothetical protein
MIVKKKIKNPPRESTWYKRAGLKRVTLDVPIKHWKYLRRLADKNGLSIQYLLVSNIEHSYEQSRKEQKK